MSYDLMVFSPEAAPKTPTDFMAWYATQTEWTEGHSYDDPAITTPGLRAWLLEMVQTFPDMNGPDAMDDHTSDHETDYGIGRAVIYAAFSWSLAKEAYETAHRLAQKHQVGFYDPSFKGPILLPQNGEWKPMKEASPQHQVINKPWWKVW
jgi:hypothetical protein